VCSFKHKVKANFPSIIISKNVMFFKPRRLMDINVYLFLIVYIRMIY
jgi:hypothetical protein